MAPWGLTGWAWVGGLGVEASQREVEKAAHMDTGAHSLLPCTLMGRPRKHLAWGEASGSWCHRRSPGSVGPTAAPTGGTQRPRRDQQ